MISVLVKVEGGIVQEILTDSKDNYINVTIVDVDKELPISVRTEEAEHNPHIFRRRCQEIIDDLQHRIGYNVTVTPNGDDICPHEFTGTLVGIKVNGVEDFLLTVKDQEDNAYDVEFDQVEFE